MLDLRQDGLNEQVMRFWRISGFGGKRVLVGYKPKIPIQPANFFRYAGPFCHSYLIIYYLVFLFKYKYVVQSPFNLLNLNRMYYQFILQFSF